MQPTKYLNSWLENHATHERYLFSISDLSALFPHLSYSSFKTLLSRAVTAGHLIRICRGLYSFRKSLPSNGLILFHSAAYLRSDGFNYISLETVLSDAGVISQIPMNWICIMSSMRSNIISCGKFGTIEFIHTNKRPTNIMKHLSYDENCRLWRADVSLALQDMKSTHRNCDLIDWDIANEFIEPN